MTFTISTSGNRERIFKKLIQASHTNSINIMDDIPWELGVNKDLMPKNEANMWIYGTKYYESLSEDEIKEIAWLEAASDASLFIHFEHLIPQILTRIIGNHKHDLDSHIYEYMHIFSREEYNHILMFHYFLRKADLPWLPLDERLLSFFKALPNMAPEIGIVFTMLIEWTSENAIVHGLKKEGLDPLTKNVFLSHHKEEIRHIKFGKEIGEEYFHTASKSEVENARALLRSVIKQLHYNYNYNVEAMRRLSFDIGFDVEDTAIIHDIKTSDNNRSLNDIRFKDINEWCSKVGIY